MRASFLSRSGQYLLSFLLIGLVTAAFVGLRNVLDTTVVTLLYLIPLGMITAFWGLGPGITSALVTFLALNYFFLRPYYTFTIHRPTDVVTLIVFFIVAVVISQLVGRMQAGLAEARLREQEATQLYELSTALVGLRGEQPIAQTLAGQVQAVTHSEHVELGISSAQPFSCHVPDADDLVLGLLAQPPGDLDPSLVGHFEEQQVSELFDVIAVVHAVMAQGVAKSPQFVYDVTH